MEERFHGPLNPSSQHRRPTLSILIKNGVVVNASGSFVGDVLIAGERIAALGSELTADEARLIDAAGAFVLPGGVDVHTHLDMPFGDTASSDDFETGTRAAAVGGTTALVDFAIQAKGDSLANTVAVWQAKAMGKAVIDYGFHVAVTDLTDGVLAEIPRLVEAGRAQPQALHGIQGRAHGRRRHALACVEEGP